MRCTTDEFSLLYLFDFCFLEILLLSFFPISSSHFSLHHKYTATFFQLGFNLNLSNMAINGNWSCKDVIPNCLSQYQSAVSWLIASGDTFRCMLSMLSFSATIFLSFVPYDICLNAQSLSNVFPFWYCTAFFVFTVIIPSQWCPQYIDEKNTNTIRTIVKWRGRKCKIRLLTFLTNKVEAPPFSIKVLLSLSFRFWSTVLTRTCLTQDGREEVNLQLWSW